MEMKSDGGYIVKPAYEETGISGLELMRRECGIAMEYLESESKEGSFLNEWEVIGGWDNYSLACERVKEIVEEKGLIYEQEKMPSRRTVERLSSVKDFFQVVTTIKNNDRVQEVASIVVTIGEDKFEIINRLNSVKDLLPNNIVEKTEAKLTGTLEYAEKVSFYETKLRVSAFKKGNILVLSFRNIVNDSKLKKAILSNKLPNEIYLMHSLIKNIKKEYPEINEIHTTGFGIGGELATLMYLLDNSVEKATVFADKELLNYKELLTLDSLEEIDENLEYLNPLELIRGNKKIIKEFCVGAIISGVSLVLIAPVTLGVSLFGAGVTISSLIYSLHKNTSDNYEKKEKIDRFLNSLKEKGYMTKKNSLSKEFFKKSSFEYKIPTLSIEIIEDNNKKIESQEIIIVDDKLFMALIYESTLAEKLVFHKDKDTIIVGNGNMSKEYILEKNSSNIYVCIEVYEWKGMAKVKSRHMGVLLSIYLTLKSQIQNRIEDASKIERIILNTNDIDNILNIETGVLTSKKIKNYYDLNINDYFPFINKSGDITGKLRDEFISSLLVSQIKVGGLGKHENVTNHVSSDGVHERLNVSLKQDGEGYNKFKEIEKREIETKNQQISFKDNSKKIDKKFFLGILYAIDETLVNKYIKELAIKQLEEKELDITYWTVVERPKKEEPKKRELSNNLVDFANATSRDSIFNQFSNSLLAGIERKNYIMEVQIGGVPISQICKTDLPPQNEKFYTPVDKPKSKDFSESPEHLNGILKIGKHDKTELNYYYNPSNKIIGGYYQTKVNGIDLIFKNN